MNQNSGLKGFVMTDQGMTGYGMTGRGMTD